MPDTKNNQPQEALQKIVFLSREMYDERKAAGTLVEEGVIYATPASDYDNGLIFKDRLPTRQEIEAMEDLPEWTVMHIYNPNNPFLGV